MSTVYVVLPLDIARPLLQPQPGKTGSNKTLPAAVEHKLDLSEANRKLNKKLEPKSYPLPPPLPPKRSTRYDRGTSPLEPLTSPKRARGYDRGTSPFGSETEEEPDYRQPHERSTEEAMLKDGALDSRGVIYDDKNKELGPIYAVWEFSTMTGRRKTPPGTDIVVRYVYNGKIDKSLFRGKFKQKLNDLNRLTKWRSF